MTVFKTEITDYYRHARDKNLFLQAWVNQGYEIMEEKGRLFAVRDV